MVISTGRAIRGAYYNASQLIAFPQVSFTYLKLVEILNSKVTKVC